MNLTYLMFSVIAFISQIKTLKLANLANVVKHMYMSTTEISWYISDSYHSIITHLKKCDSMLQRNTVDVLKTVS